MEPKIASSGNLAPRASWELPGLDFQAFGGSFWGFPNRSKNGTKNELIFKPGPGGPRGPQELRLYPPGVVLRWFWRPGGRLQRGVLRLRTSEF